MSEELPSVGSALRTRHTNPMEREAAVPQDPAAGWSQTPTPPRCQKFGGFARASVLPQVCSVTVGHNFFAPASSASGPPCVPPGSLAAARYP